MLELLIALLLLIAIVLSSIYYYIRSILIKERTSISFKESLDLAELPIITFTQNNVKINFLLDSGATISVIDEFTLRNLKSTLSNTLSRTTGIGGSIANIPNVDMEIYYKKLKFVDTFQVINMDKIFKEIKSSTGVTVHGILGTSFMQKYKYVLDFDKMIAYSKKK